MKVTGEEEAVEGSEHGATGIDEVDQEEKKSKKETSKKSPKKKTKLDMIKNLHKKTPKGENTKPKLRLTRSNSLDSIRRPKVSKEMIIMTQSYDF